MPPSGSAPSSSERLGRPDPGVGEAAQPAADALGQLGRGLAGEGEAQHLVGLDVAVGDQPDDARGHRLGLAGAGAGHDEDRPQRVGLDDGALLVGRRGQPSASARPSGGVGGHRSVLPSGMAGHDVFTGQKVHHEPGVAANSRPPIPSAVSATSAAAHAGVVLRLQRRLLLERRLARWRRPPCRGAAARRRPRSCPRCRTPRARRPAGRCPAAGGSATSSALGLLLPVL